MISFIVILFASLQATAAPGSRSAQSVFDGMQALIPQMCLPASTLRACFTVNKETCDSRVVSAFETCLRDQKIKFAGRTMLDPQAAADAENSLKSCVLSSYSMSTWTSYKKSPDCDKWVPQVKKPGEKITKAAPSKRTETAFEDPLDNQRDMAGRYKLRLLHDLRLTKHFQAELEERKICINDKTSRESNLNCFKRALAKFEITSSVQIVSLATIAIAFAKKDEREGFASSNAVLLDALLAVGERVQIEKFHLTNLIASSDADRVALNLLRVDDEKILSTSAAKYYAMLKQKLNAPAKGREPANLSNLKMRIEALKSPGWIYARNL